MRYVETRSMVYELGQSASRCRVSGCPDRSVVRVRLEAVSIPGGPDFVYGGKTLVEHRATLGRSGCTIRVRYRIRLFVKASG